jgi:hypothetical protein
VERDGQQDGRITEAWGADGGPEGTEEFSELSAQPFATMKFQLQDGGAQVSGVKAETAGKIEGVFLPPALGAKSFAGLKGALTREGKATSGAKRSRPGSKVLPAFPANARSGHAAELLAAKRAIRRKDGSNQTIDKLLEERKGGAVTAHV